MSALVDIKDREGHTVLQAAVEAAWVPGVCVALEAGADVTLKVKIMKIIEWLARSNGKPWCQFLQQLKKMIEFVKSRSRSSYCQSLSR